MSTHQVAQKVCNSVYDGVTTKELDELSAQISISLSLEHPDYGDLASRICISFTKARLASTWNAWSLCSNRNSFRKVYEQCKENIDIIEATIDYEGIIVRYLDQNLMKSYLLQSVGPSLSPQDMWMMWLWQHEDDIDNVIETYNMLSNKYFTHATHVDNAEVINLAEQLLFAEMNDDSITGIQDVIGHARFRNTRVLSDCVHKLRATGSNIGKLKNACTGLLPVLRIFNDFSIRQSRGKRPVPLRYTCLPTIRICQVFELRKSWRRGRTVS